MDNTENTEQKINTKKKQAAPLSSLAANIYEIVEMLGIVTVVSMIVFMFIIRVSVVDGSSMEKTLHHKDYLLVSDLFYEPTPGDIVIIHDISAYPYDEPIVKRVIATAGDKVYIDFDTGTVYVNDVALDEDYAFLDPNATTLKCEYPLPIIVPDNEVFVLGDNRNGSADSRQVEIGTIDERCIVGRAMSRILPLGSFTTFPHSSK